MTDSVIEVVFDPLDAIRPDEVDELLDELQNVDLQADATCVENRGVLVEGMAIIALITVATTTVSGLCVVVGFLHRAFASGVVVDASQGQVRVHRDATLPRGSVLMIPLHGDPVLSYNVSGDDLRSLMSSVLHGAGSKDE
jgi:hypothetical protein